MAAPSAADAQGASVLRAADSPPEPIQRAQLCAGARVTLCGLQNAALNGRAATAVRFDAETQRWLLDVEGMGEPRLIKPTNVQLA